MKRTVILALAAVIAPVLPSRFMKNREERGDNLVILDPMAAPKNSPAKKAIDPEKFRNQIDEAGKAGKITPEQADSKLEWMRAQSTPSQPHPRSKE